MWSGSTSISWGPESLIDGVLWATLAIGSVILGLAVAAFGLRIRSTIRARRYDRWEVTWEPILLDVLSDAADVEHLYETVGPRSKRHFLLFLMRYARLLTGEDRRRITHIAAPFLPELVEDLDARRAAKRALTVQMLATLGIEEHGSAIARSLEDRSDLVSMVGARALSGSRNPEHIGSLLANLHRYGKWNNRFLASMLAPMGFDISPSLRAFLGRDGNPLDRAVAADALVLLTDPAAGDVAAAVLSATPHRELAAACLRLLRAVGNPEHLTIVRSYIRGGDKVLRALAIRALGTIGGPDDLDLLERGMADSDPWVAINSAEALLEAGGLDRLRELADTDDHPQASLAREVMLGRAA